MPDGNAAYATGIASVAAGSLAVELLPEKTGRLGTRTSIGPRLALVVDGTLSMRTIHGTLLQLHGFDVEAYASLDEAAARCRAVTPDVVVMEPRALGADSLHVLGAWRERVLPADPPVVWCTTVTPTQRHLDGGARLGLRGVVIKPFRLEALMALVVRVVRTAERESRLRACGVDLRQLGGLLSPSDASLWLRVEGELAEQHARPLSLVCVSDAAPTVQRAVRGVIRNVDLLALVDAQTLAVLLPDVDAGGASVVARRVASAVGDAASVWRVTQVAGESGAELLERALHRP